MAPDRGRPGHLRPVIERVYTEQTWLPLRTRGGDPGRRRPSGLVLSPRPPACQGAAGFVFAPGRPTAARTFNPVLGDNGTAVL